MIKKRILVLMTSDVKICDCVEENLRFLDYDYLIIKNDHFKYRSLKDRLVNFYRKTFLKDKLYKSGLARKYELEKNLKLLNSNLEKFDYALVIRPDKFNIEVLKKVKELSNYSVAYQWDGMSRFPEAKDTIPYFDKFYVFDRNDIPKFIEPLSFTTNFYFDCYNNLFNKLPEYDVYFIGSYDKRIDDLITICEKLHALGLKLNILLLTSPKRKLKEYKYINYLKKPLTYYQNLEMVAKTKIIIDLGHKKLHTGLSFRTFESLGYDKKLITTNSTVKEFDFYNESNIFIIDENIEKLKSFIQTEYIIIDSKIKEKYGFTNWLKFMINSEPFDKIS